MCRINMTEYPACGSEYLDVELSDIDPGKPRRHRHRHRHRRPHSPLTPADESTWCRRFQIVPCATYLRKGETCHKIRNLDSMYNAVRLGLVESSRKVVLGNCNQRACVPRLAQSLQY